MSCPLAYSASHAPMLMEVVRERIRAKHYSRRTEQSYRPNTLRQHSKILNNQSRLIGFVISRVNDHPRSNKLASRVQIVELHS